MGHYKANIRDLEFNLFEANDIRSYLGSGPFASMDPDTARMVLREVQRLASGVWADSFIEADRTPLELKDGKIVLIDSLKKSIDAYRDAGWGRMGMPDELGGAGAPPSLIWATVAMLTGANPTAYLYASGELMARVMFEEGNDEQKKIAQWMLDRNWGGTMVLTEPDAGSDVGAGTSKATQIEGDLYHLEGVKRFTTSAEFDHAENIIHLVLARPHGAGPGTKGLSLFMVPKFLINDDGTLGERNGVFATNIEKKMGIRGSATCELTFGLDAPALGWLVGSKHDGIRQMFRVIEHARMLIGTKSAATLSTGYLNALEFARERKQGADLTEATDKTAPRVEIIRHPDVRRMLMLQKSYSEGLRALVMYTAWVQDQIMLHPDDDHWNRLNDLLLPMVKGYSSEKAYELLTQSLQVFGGSGFTTDYPIEQYIRDAKIDTLYEGTTGIQAMDLFFRKIAKDQGATLTRLAAQIVE
ncbi:MAG: acyl-CoA dehydrogenase family protein, partial [Acidimicrobiia bacterium]|nr:acyl-CoA dehydrogenase family protein [Acidimicrobiia bacterium]